MLLELNLFAFGSIICKSNTLIHLGAGFTTKDYSTNKKAIADNSPGVLMDHSDVSIWDLFQILSSVEKLDPDMQNMLAELRSFEYACFDELCHRILGHWIENSENKRHS